MTRIVVVNPFPVLPAQSGGQLAVWGLTAELARRWPTTLVWTERGRAARRQVQAGDAVLQVDVVPRSWLQRRAARGLSRWLGGVEHDAGAMLFSGMHRALHHCLAASVHDGDIVIAAHPWLAPAVLRLRRERRFRLVYDAHNVEWALKAARWPRNRVSAWLLARVQALEATLVRQADLVLACTEGDAQALAALGGIDPAQLLVGSKGIEPSTAADAMARARLARPPGRRALFVGANHPPNHEAARWISTVLAPACPDWQFVIAGACGTAAVAGANVQVTGVLPDLAPELAAADVALNPMVSGSGINMKLLQSLQCGLPGLSTPLGARGFEAVAASGLQVLEREGFAAALRGLDPATWRRLAQEGPACIAAHFTWPAIGERVGARLAALAARA